LGKSAKKERRPVYARLARLFSLFSPPRSYAHTRRLVAVTSLSPQHSLVCLQILFFTGCPVSTATRLQNSRHNVTTVVTHWLPNLNWKFVFLSQIRAILVCYPCSFKPIYDNLRHENRWKLKSLSISRRKGHWDFISCLFKYPTQKFIFNIFVGLLVIVLCARKGLTQTWRKIEVFHKEWQTAEMPNFPSIFLGFLWDKASPSPPVLDVWESVC